MIFYKRVLFVFVFFIFFIFSTGVWGSGDFVVRPDNGRNLSSAASAKDNSTAEPESSSGRRWIMAVGICKFADTRISQLTYCVDDARSISNYFRSDGVDDAQIIFLADEEAEKGSVMGSLKSLAEKIAPDDTLFFFYSSHGAGDSSGKTYFITFDTVIDDLAATALPMQELKSAVEKIKCRDVVMMIDTCHSGGAKSLGRQDEKAFDKLVRTADRGTRVAILTSSRTHETSIESDEWKHGAFTYFMLDALGGASDNFPKDGRVSVTELFDYVMVAVPRATDRAQHPSGKFSYNWPGKKEQDVKVGKVVGAGSSVGSVATGQIHGEKGQPGVSGEAWQNVIGDR